MDKNIVDNSYSYFTFVCGDVLFIGTQVFMGSTQLVTCEDTSKVKDSFWERYNMDYDVFCSTYTIEKVEITSTFDEHMIPADYIYALGEEGDKNNPTVILVHGLGGNRYTNYPLAEMFLQKPAKKNQ